jgi:hypothetical protein
MMQLLPREDPLWCRVLEERSPRARLVIAWIHASRRHRTAAYLELGLAALPTDLEHVGDVVTITIAGELVGSVHVDELLG